MGIYSEYYGAADATDGAVDVAAVAAAVAALVGSSGANIAPINQRTTTTPMPVPKRPDTIPPAAIPRPVREPFD